MTQQDKQNPSEEIKAASRLLRGDIAAELAEDSDQFSAASVQLLKHHGAYQQDNRDERASARAAGESGKRMMLMVRTRVPGGQLTSPQLLAELDLCDRLGNGTLRVTSRQGLQMHGVLKANLRDVIRHIRAVHLTTLAACGDVNRNVMCCPAPGHAPWHGELQQLARRLAEHFAPRTGAYRDIWLRDPETGEKHVVDGGDPGAEEEPIYGRTYLPRKFKIGIALPEDNCIDVYTHDLGLLAIVEHDRILGYNVLVGGGMGVTPSNKKTYAALGKLLAFVAPGDVVQVAEAVVKVQRDHGNREDRKLARLKYLVDRWGLDVFRTRVEEYWGQTLAPPRATAVSATQDHLGWETQGDGRWYYGLNIENGRIADTVNMRLKSALRQICQELSPGLRLTAYQSILLTDLQESDRPRLEGILIDHQVPLSEEVSTVRRWSMACVAWPTCGLAITESERALPGIIDVLEAELAKMGLAHEAFTVRMTGCPNGCVRPYNADIGLVGKARGRYTLYLGGSRLGTRLNFVYQDLVPAEDIVPRLRPLFAYFRQDRQAGESFGDFCHRKGCQDLQTWAQPSASDPQ
ncbi:MAG: NADPH-dependent assimilatory sulfite reductase hemoprotein subunit [Pirellulaceae bacterium]